MLPSMGNILGCQRAAYGGTETAEMAFGRAVWGDNGLRSGDDQLELVHRASVKDETQEWAEFLVVKSNSEFGMGALCARSLDTR